MLLRRSALLAASRSASLCRGKGPSPATLLPSHSSSALSELVPKASVAVLLKSGFSLERFLARHGLSTTTEEGKEATSPKGEAGAASATERAAGAPGLGSEDTDVSVEELQEAIKQLGAEKDELKKQLAEAKERLVYTLADMENLRDRTARQAAETKKFAIQGFVKSILDVADNLERAANAVPQEVTSEHSTASLDAESARKMLLSMLEGVQMTEKILLQVFAQNGIEKVNPLGDKFDPNMHQALFEMPDPSKEPGTVGTVIKSGYTLHGRVVRSADVGVVKAT